MVDISRKRKGEHLRDKITELESNSKNKFIREHRGASIHLRIIPVCYANIYV
jgi:hypothetical protein